MLSFLSLNHVHPPGLDAMLNSDTNDYAQKVKAKALIVFVHMNQSKRTRAVFVTELD